MKFSLTLGAFTIVAAASAMASTALAQGRTVAEICTAPNQGNGVGAENQRVICAIMVELQSKTGAKRTLELIPLDQISGIKGPSKRGDVFEKRREQVAQNTCLALGFPYLEEYDFKKVEESSSNYGKPTDLISLTCAY